MRRERAFLDGETATMSRDEDEFFAAKKPAPSQHVLGEPLDTLSVDELTARIDVLRAEIGRLEAAREKKDASRAAAAAFFKS
jgi:uncharacterized small protein (DUF1192 family)